MEYVKYMRVSDQIQIFLIHYGSGALNGLVVKMNVISRRAVVERPVGSSVAQVVLRAAPMLALDHPLMATRTAPFNGQIYFLGGKKAKVVIHISKSTRTFCLQPCVEAPT